MLVCVYAQNAHKKIASCRLREKNFASLRLRKNLVELRARLSLLIDKTTFQYSALTIYYATIGGDVPFLPVPSAASRGGRDALDVPGSPPPARPPWDGRKRGPRTRRITTSAPAAMVEGDALDAHGFPSAVRASLGFAFSCALLAPVSEHKKAAHQGRSYQWRGFIYIMLYLIIIPVDPDV